MRHLDLFSGIGGFAIAAESVWEDVEHIFCDNDSFSQAVLKKHWPNAKIHGDIKQLSGEEIGTVDIVTGGFPCQPFSAAGKRRGTEDDRHLWPEMLRIIRETTPTWVIGENVGGLLTWDGGVVFDQVCTDLEAEGYEVWPFLIPACSIGAPHKRDRVWIVAHSNRGADGRSPGRDASEIVTEGVRQRDTVGKPSEPSNVRVPADTKSIGSNGRLGKTGTRCELSNSEERDSTWSEDARCRWDEDWPTVATRLCAVDDGLSDRLVRPRGWRNAALKAAGNAIVPQVAIQIMTGIKYATL